MEKLYKYNTNKKIKELFKEYDRDNYSLAGYQFIRKYVKNYVNKFDVIQLCDMFTETSFFELFGEEKTNISRQIELIKQFKKDNKGIHLKILNNGNVIYWNGEHLHQLRFLAKL